MTPDEKVRRAKDIAARKAFEAYGETLHKLLQEEGLPLASVAETTHIHSALLFEKKTAIVVLCQWSFTAKSEILENAIARAKMEGKG